MRSVALQTVSQSRILQVKTRVCLSTFSTRLECHAKRDPTGCPIFIYFDLFRILFLFYLFLYRTRALHVFRRYRGVLARRCHQSMKSRSIQLFFVQVKNATATANFLQRRVVILLKFVHSYGQDQPHCYPKFPEGGSRVLSCLLNVEVGQGIPAKGANGTGTPATPGG